MKKHELADQLRQRLYESGSAAKGAVDALSDDEVIGCYVSCSHCGTRVIGEEELRRAVTYTTDPDLFVKACGLQDHCGNA
jgi:hypothetical protein